MRGTDGMRGGGDVQWRASSLSDAQLCWSPPHGWCQTWCQRRSGCVGVGGAPMSVDSVYVSRQKRKPNLYVCRWRVIGQPWTFWDIGEDYVVSEAWQSGACFDFFSSHHSLKAELTNAATVVCLWLTAEEGDGVFNMSESVRITGLLLSALGSRAE